MSVVIIDDMPATRTMFKEDINAYYSEIEIISEAKDGMKVPTSIKKKSLVIEMSQNL